MVLLLKRIRFFRSVVPVLALLAGTVLLVLAGCASTLQDPRYAYNKGDYTQALTQSRRWLERNPEDTRVRRLAGYAALELGDSSRAYTLWKPAAGMYVHGDADLGSLIIDLAIRHEDLETAQDLLRIDTPTLTPPQIEKRKQLYALVSLRINNAARLVQLGDKALANKNVKHAHDLYLRAEADNPSDQNMARERVARAALFAAAGGRTVREHVVKMLDVAEKLWPDSPLILYMDGKLSVQVGLEKRAKAAFSRAVGLAEMPPWSDLARREVNLLSH